MGQYQVKKHLGQHFLHDAYVINKIIDAMSLQRHEQVLEIGPGLGALTTHLSQQLAHLYVVEIDQDCIARLQENFLSSAVTIIHQDILTFAFEKFSKPLRVVGNLPYNISTPLIFHCLDSANIIQDMHFMVQKEVAERMVAKPHNKTYGRLSVMVQRYCEVELLFKVSRGAFSPPPLVTSAVCRLKPRQDLVNDPKRGLFTEVVKAAFGHRRKQLKTNVKKWFLPSDLLALGIEPTLRAENLTVADYAKLVDRIS